MVANDLGIGFVPQSFLENEQHGVYTLRLRETIPSRSICYAKPANHPLNAAARKLEEMLLSASARKLH